MVCASIKAHSSAGSIGTLASAYVIAAMKYGKLYLPELENCSPSTNSFASVAFGDVCSISLMDDLNNGLVNLGWPEHSVNLNYAHQIADALAMSGSYNSNRRTWHIATQESETDESLVQLKDLANGTSEMLSKALRLAEILLVRATQEDWLEIELDELQGENREKDDESFVVALVGSFTKRLKINDFFARSFSAFPEANTKVPEALTGTLAVSSRGQTLLTRGLLLEDVEAPRSAREALQLLVLPGQMKWRGTRQSFLEET